MKYSLIVGDAREVIQGMAKESIHLVVTLPPYNLGKEYEVCRPLEEYIKGFRGFIENLYRIVHPLGSVCWQVGNYVKGGEVFPLDILFYPYFREAGFHLRNRIVWHFGHGLHAKRRFSGRYEVILWFTKGDRYTFNLDAVRVPSKYPGERHYKGPHKGKPSGNPLGKNPSDFWELGLIREEWESGIFNFPNVKANHPEKTEHPCQFPIELAERCVLALTNEGDAVCDPFMGVGTTVLAAVMHQRVGVGIDREQKYVEIARERIEQLCADKLPYRPLGKPIYQPSGREKVARVPEEWASIFQR